MWLQLLVISAWVGVGIFVWLASVGQKLMAAEAAENMARKAAEKAERDELMVEYLTRAGLADDEDDARRQIAEGLAS